MLLAIAAVSPMPPNGKSSAILVVGRAVAVDGGAATCAVGAGGGPMEVEQAGSKPISGRSARARSARAPPCPRFQVLRIRRPFPHESPTAPKAAWPPQREQCNDSSENG